MNTTTPRTDEQASREITTDGTWIAHSRTLERELAALAAELNFQLARNSRLFTQRDEAHAELAALTAERDNGETGPLLDEMEMLEREFAAERAIVSRIWVQLGSPSYEQLKGRSIYDLIDEMKAELADTQQEGAHYISVAQKATDELIRLRAENLAAHKMACAAGLERDQLRAELATERARLNHVLRIDCAFDDRAEIDNDIKNMTEESKK